MPWAIDLWLRCGECGLEACCIAASDQPSLAAAIRRADGWQGWAVSKRGSATCKACQGAKPKSQPNGPQPQPKALRKRRAHEGPSRMGHQVIQAAQT